MTDYHLRPPDTLPTFAWQEKKEKRRKLLEEVRHRRRMLYQKMRKRRNPIKSSSS